MSQFKRIHSLMLVHTVPTEEEGSTWLQLFFDLVYVAILVELGNRLSHELDLEGILVFVAMFIPIWWSWLEFVDYGRRYPVDDVGQRLLTVLYMATMLLLAFEIHSVSPSTIKAFIITYGLSKFILALMYARAWIYYPTYRHLTRDNAWAFVLVGTLWIIIALTAPEDLRLWAVVIVLGALMPLLIHLLRSATGSLDLPRPPIKHVFTLHRFGELTIIVLGEFFIKLVVGSSDRQLAGISYLIGAGLLVISLSLWWLYFDHLEHSGLAKVRDTHLRIWVYSHLPFLTAITAYGIVGNKIFGETPREPLGDTKRLLFTSALAIALLTYGLIEWSSGEKDEPLARPPQPWLRIGGAAALLVLGIFGHSLNVGWLVALVVAIMLLQVARDIHARLQRPEPGSPQPIMADKHGT